MLNKHQFTNHFNGLSEDEIERRWKIHQWEEEQMMRMMFEQAKATQAAQAAVASGAAGGGGFSSSELLVEAISWGIWAPGGSGDNDYDNFNTWTTESFPAVANVSRLVLFTGAGANAHVHSDYPYSDLTIELYDNSSETWVQVWSYRIENPNYPEDDSPDYFFDVDVAFPTISQVTSIRLTSNPGSDQTYHDWSGATFDLYQSGTAPSSLQLVWSSIDNTPVADPTNVNDWNDHFGDPYFTTVSVIGNIVNLTPGGTVTFTDNVFSPDKDGNQYLIEVIDNANCVTAVNYQALANCYNLTKAIFPACETIGFAAFENSNNLSTVDFSAVEEIDVLGLGDLHSIASLNLPALTTAGNYAFSYNYGMTSFSAPNLTTTGVYCFSDCYRLPTISLPSVVSVGNNAFSDCSSLTSISLPVCTSLGTTVSNNNVFSGISGNTIALTVPAALMTCNAGDPDGDIQYLQANNTVTGLPVVSCNTLTLTGINATTTANSATNDGTGGWDSSAYSTQTYTEPVILKFRTSNDSNILMGGFAYTPTLEVDTYLNTTYGIYFTGQASYEIYENGNQVNTGVTTRSVNDVWKVIYDGTDVKYYQNSTLLYTSANAVTAPLHVFFAFNTASQGVTNICAI